jgi:hypothetical protein
VGRLPHFPEVGTREFVEITIGLRI